MKKIKKRDKKIRSTVGKIIIGLALASMVGGLSALPALGQDRPIRASDRNRVERRGPDRDRFERRGPDRDAYYHRRVYRNYPPPTPFFVPPPVVFEPPPPPPGISIFFPPFLFR